MGTRAGDGNRTRIASLEGWSSTIELHPRAARRLVRGRGTGDGVSVAHVSDNGRMDPSKRCARCRLHLPLSAFGYRDAAHTMLQSYCRTCQNAASRDWYADPDNRRRHKSLVRKRRRRRIARHRAIVAELKSQPCADCGQTFPTHVMTSTTAGTRPPRFPSWSTAPARPRSFRKSASVTSYAQTAIGCARSFGLPHTAEASNLLRYRAVAQFGSARRLGRRGRRFKSDQPDQDPQSRHPALLEGRPNGAGKVKRCQREAPHSGRFGVPFVHSADHDGRGSALFFAI